MNIIQSFIFFLLSFGAVAILEILYQRSPQNGFWLLGFFAFLTLFPFQKTQIFIVVALFVSVLFSIFFAQNPIFSTVIFFLLPWLIRHISFKTKIPTISQQFISGGIFFMLLAVIHFLQTNFKTLSSMSFSMFPLGFSVFIFIAVLYILAGLLSGNSFSASKKHYEKIFC